MKKLLFFLVALLSMFVSNVAGATITIINSITPGDPHTLMVKLHPAIDLELMNLFIAAEGRFGDREVCCRIPSQEPSERPFCFSFRVRQVPPDDPQLLPEMIYYQGTIAMDPIQIAQIDAMIRQYPDRGGIMRVRDGDRITIGRVLRNVQIDPFLPDLLEAPGQMRIELTVPNHRRLPGIPDPFRMCIIPQWASMPH